MGKFNFNMVTVAISSGGLLSKAAKAARSFQRFDMLKELFILAILCIG